MATRVTTPLVVGMALMFALAGCTSGSKSTTDAQSPSPSGSTSASPSPSASASASPSGGASSAAPQPSSPASASVTGAAVGPPACETAQLRLRQGNVEGAAGSTYATYYLEDVGTGACTMDGYPGFALLRADGSVIQHPAERSRVPHHPVTLHHGERATFVVRSLDPSTPGTGCSPAWRTAQVQVYPPDQTKAIRQPSNLSACDLTVEPVSKA